MSNDQQIGVARMNRMIEANILKNSVNFSFSLQVFCEFDWELDELEVHK